MAKNQDPTAPLLQVQLKISEKLYLKDPDSTSLGRRIIYAGVHLIDKIGFEQFNFKKLAQEMAARLNERGVYVTAFSFPVVPKDQDRIRTQMSAALTRDMLDQAIDAFEAVGRELGVIS